MPKRPRCTTLPPLYCGNCGRPIGSTPDGSCWHCTYRARQAPCRCRHDPEYVCCCRLDCRRYVTCPAAPLLR